MLSLDRAKQDKGFKYFNSISSIQDIVNVQLPAYKGRTAIRYDNGSTYKSISFDSYIEYVHKMIQFFQAAQAEQKVVATFCKNRIEWDMTAMATFYTANIIFPIDTKFNDVELNHIFGLNRPDFILVSRPQLKKIRALKENLLKGTKILVADHTNCFEDIGFEEYTLEEGELSISQYLAETELTESVKESALLHEQDTILGHYPTSGTTSLPKIVQITATNIVCEINEAIDVLNLRTKEEVLNIGPYTHIATLVEFLTTKTRGFTVTYFTREPDEDDVLEDEIKKIKKLGIRIKVLMAVPKFWIYLLKEVLEEMKNKPILHNLYSYLSSIEKQGNLYDISTIDKAKLTAVRTLLRNKLGGYFSYGISSSMKLDGALVTIFGKLGITVLDIYGATEACGIISRNKINDVNAGTCGRIIEPLEYRVTNKHTVPGVSEEVGILEIKGPTIMHSYLGGEKFDRDSYFSTGDVAWISEDGLVNLVGRQKDLIRWNDGSYVDPQHISNLLVRSIFVKDAMVANHNNEYLSVYIYPDYKRVKKDPRWKKEIETGVTEDIALRRRLEEAIDYAQSIANISARLDKQKIFLLPKALERTPTHKIKFIFELERLHLAREI